MNLMTDLKLEMTQTPTVVQRPTTTQGSWIRPLRSIRSPRIRFRVRRIVAEPLRRPTSRTTTAARAAHPAATVWTLDSRTMRLRPAILCLLRRWKIFRRPQLRLPPSQQPLGVSAIAAPANPRTVNGKS